MCHGRTNAKPVRSALAILKSVVAPLLAVLILIQPLPAGECVDAMNPNEIIRRLAGADPDGLPLEAGYVLGCLDYRVSALRWRPDPLLPSWRLLRNIRREYRDLRRKHELVAVVKPLLQSSSSGVRSSAARALVLYGETTYTDSLVIGGRLAGRNAMVLAVAGDTMSVGATIEAYRSPDSRGRLALLDALYYLSTPRAVCFITAIASDSADVGGAERAQWMLGNPMPVEASWRL